MSEKDRQETALEVRERLTKLIDENSLQIGDLRK